ncbi:hypothetical protein KC330_g15 [Hortaea werneckii]|nr:hypothetical protein KC330_g15 [Hortaea werneckii]
MRVYARSAILHRWSVSASLICSRRDQSQRAGSTNAAGAVLFYVSKMLFRKNWVESYRIAMGWVASVVMNVSVPGSYAPDYRHRSPVLLNVVADADGVGVTKVRDPAVLMQLAPFLSMLAMLFARLLVNAVLELDCPYAGGSPSGKAATAPSRARKDALEYILRLKGGTDLHIPSLLLEVSIRIFPRPSTVYALIVMNLKPALDLSYQYEDVPNTRRALGSTVGFRACACNAVGRRCTSAASNTGADNASGGRSASVSKFSIHSDLLDEVYSISLGLPSNCQVGTDIAERGDDALPESGIGLTSRYKVAIKVGGTPAGEGWPRSRAFEAPQSPKANLALLLSIQRYGTTVVPLNEVSQLVAESVTGDRAASKALV